MWLVTPRGHCRRTAVHDCGPANIHGTLIGPSKSRKGAIPPCRLTQSSAPRQPAVGSRKKAARFRSTLVCSPLQRHCCPNRTGRDTKLGGGCWTAMPPPPPADPQSAPDTRGCLGQVAAGSPRRHTSRRPLLKASPGCPPRVAPSAPHFLLIPPSPRTPLCASSRPRTAWAPQSRGVRGAWEGTLGGRRRCIAPLLTRLFHRTGHPLSF